MPETYYSTGRGTGKTMMAKALATATDVPFPARAGYKTYRRVMLVTGRGNPPVI